MKRWRETEVGEASSAFLTRAEKAAGMVRLMSSSSLESRQTVFHQRGEGGQGNGLEGGRDEPERELDLGACLERGRGVKV